MLPMRRPRGQILVITAASMIVLLAIGAIVVDLGLSWMLRRHEQNAVDPGAIAAARAIPAGDVAAMRSEACFFAQENGFFVGDTGCAAALGSGNLEVNWPPVPPLAVAPYIGNPGYVQVVIHDTHPSFFGQLFGRPLAVVVTSAVAANTSGNANSSSLVALRDDCIGDTTSGQVSGGGTIRVIPAAGVESGSGGWVRVNAPCGSPHDDQCLAGSESSLVLNGSAKLIAPFVFVAGTCTANGSAKLICPPGVANCLEEGAGLFGDPLAGVPEPDLDVDVFRAGLCPDGSLEVSTRNTPCRLGGNGSAGCATSGAGTRKTWTCTIEPGIYYAGWQIGSKTTLVLKDGMYIIAGGGIRLNAGEELSSLAGGTGRVTIFSTDGPGCTSPDQPQCQGPISINAQASFRARATSADSCRAIVAAGGPNTCPWAGILLWQDGTVMYPGSPVKIGGGSNVLISGTIYAPKSDVEVAGGSGTSGCSGNSNLSCLSIQIISWTWKVTGGALVELPYDPKQLYQLDQQGLVY